MPDIIYSITLVAGAIVIIYQERRITKVEKDNKHLVKVVRIFIKEIFKEDGDGENNNLV